MVSPADETAAGAQRHARLRASAADREQAIEVIKAAFVQDRITKDELDQRIGQVLASRTYADLDVLTADLPAGPIRAQPAEPARLSVNGKNSSGARAPDSAARSSWRPRRRHSRTLTSSPPCSLDPYRESSWPGC